MNKLLALFRKRAVVGTAIFCLAALATFGALGKEEDGDDKNPDLLVDLNETEEQGGKLADNTEDAHQQIALLPDGTDASEDTQSANKDTKPDITDANKDAGKTEDKTTQQDTKQEEPEVKDTGAQVAEDAKATDAKVSEDVKPDGGKVTADKGNEGTKDGDTQVLSPQLIAEQLTYNKTNGLMWPVEGEVIIPYSPDHGVFYQTLDHFSTSDALVLSSTVGEEVRCAAKGVVVSIEEDVRTGTTVTMALGNNTNVVYGQLKVDGLKEGDILEAGECLGTVAEPTRYYVVEGPNLYFQVLENAKSINPSELLK